MRSAERRSLNCDLPRVMGVIGIVCKIETSCFAFTLRKIKFGALSLILVLILDLRFKWLPWEMGLKAWQALWGDRAQGFRHRTASDCVSSGKPCTSEPGLKCRWVIISGCMVRIQVHELQSAPGGAS